jgi:L-iditol 2-dehydrogenase
MVTSVVGSRSRNNQYPIPERMKAWVLGGPEELSLVKKPVPEPGRAEVLVRVDAIAVCATDIEIIRHGVPAMIDGGSPFNRGFTPGHEYMGTIVKLGPTVDEFEVGDRVTVEVHAGCGRCQRCREGMYTSCLNYGYRAKGHRANGFSTDGGFAEYAVNNINTLARIPDEMSDAEATLVVTAGTAMYGARCDGRRHCRRGRGRHRPGADRAHGHRCRQGIRRPTRHLDRHPRPAA